MTSQGGICAYASLFLSRYISVLTVYVSGYVCEVGKTIDSAKFDFAFWFRVHTEYGWISSYMLP